MEFTRPDSLATQWVAAAPGMASFATALRCPTLPASLRLASAPAALATRSKGPTTTGLPAFAFPSDNPSPFCESNVE